MNKNYLVWDSATTFEPEWLTPGAQGVTRNWVKARSKDGAMRIYSFEELPRDDGLYMVYLLTEKQAQEIAQLPREQQAKAAYKACKAVHSYIYEVCDLENITAAERRELIDECEE